MLLPTLDGKPVGMVKKLADYTSASFGVHPFLPSAVVMNSRIDLINRCSKQISCPGSDHGPGLIPLKTAFSREYNHPIGPSLPKEVLHVLPTRLPLSARPTMEKRHPRLRRPERYDRLRRLRADQCCHAPQWAWLYGKPKIPQPKTEECEWICQPGHSLGRGQPDL